MKKRLISVLIGMFVLVLAGCGGGKLPEGVSKADVETKAKEVITAVNEKNEDKLSGMCNDVLKKGFTKETMAQVFDQVEKSGAFESVADINVSSQKAENIEYSVAIVKAKYKNNDIIYTLSFDKDMKLGGFYLK